MTSSYARRVYTLYVIDKYRRSRRRRSGGSTATAAAPTDPANTTYASDAFNRTDGNIGTADVGGAWQDLTGNWRVLSNRARVNNAAARRHATIDSNASGTYYNAADGKWRVTLAITGSSGLTIRWTDANNCLYLLAGGTGITLYRITAGVLTAIGNTADAALNNDEIRIDASGSAIDVYLNSALEFSVVETQGQSLTRHGLITSDISTRFDNWSHKNF